MNFINNEIREESDIDNKQTEQHSIAKSTILHLLPGIPTTIFYIVMVPYVQHWGLPPMFAMLLSIILILIPLELGHLFYKGKKMHGKYTLKGTLLYPNQTSLGKLSLYVLIVLIIGFVLSGLIASFNAILVERYLAWLPEWFFFLIPVSTASFPSRPFL